MLKHMGKVVVNCDWCGCRIEKYSTVVHRHNFCCREHLALFSSRKANPEGYAEFKEYKNISAHMSALNQELNPKRDFDKVASKDGVLLDVLTPREKLRLHRIGTGKGKGYAKLWSRHEHRIIAEQILGRPLRPGEIVHHLDGNKRNNKPENLIVFSSQAEHARWHKKGGDIK